jgi:FkbM family methyltransferase
MPVYAAELFRRSPPPRHLGPVVGVARQVLRRGGIPRGVRTFALPDNAELRFVNADSLVLQQLYWFGEQGWEPELLPWWRRLCSRAAKVVELGTNVGYFAVQGGKAAPHARYLAVEPHPVSAHWCRQNLALNGVGCVEVLAAAAVAGPAGPSVELVVPWEQLGAPTVAFLRAGCELPRGMTHRVGTTIEVPAVDVRSLLDGVDLLKVDVEGQEHALLSAAWDQLRTYRPTVIVELLPGTPQLRAQIVRMCTELDYRCYVPTPTRLVPLTPRRIPEIALQREHRTNDLVLAARTGKDPGRHLSG